MDWITSFHFLRPMWLLMLVPSVAIFWLLRRHQHGVDGWSNVISPELLKHILIEQVKTGKKPIWAIGLALMLASVALAGPTFNKKPVTGYYNSIPTVFLLDVSWSMNATDMKPTRLQHAKIKIMQWLKQNPDMQHALIAYAGFANSVVPISFDGNTIKHLLPSINPEIMPSFGSNISSAITAAIQLAKNSDLSQINIMALTDGTSVADAKKGANIIDEEDDIKVKLAVLALGKNNAPVRFSDRNELVKYDNNKLLRADIDFDGIQLLAQLSSGLFVTNSMASADLNNIKSFFSQSFLDKDGKNKNIIFDVWDDAGYWLALLLLPLVLLLFRKGWFICLLLATLNLPQKSFAFDMADVWQTPDQQAAQKYQDGDFDKAQKLFTKPKWQAMSLYQAKNYAEAQAMFAEDNTDIGRYNLATALAKQNKLEPAISLYEKLIKNPTTSKDIKDKSLHNKAILDKLKKQNNNKKDNKKDNQKDNKDQQNKDKQNKEQQNKDQQNKDQQNKNQKNKEQQNKDKQNEEQQNKDQQNKDKQPNEEKEPKDDKDAKNKKELDKKDAKKNKKEKEDKNNKKQLEQAKDNKNTSEKDPLANLTPMEKQQLNGVDNDVGTLLKRKFRLQYLQNKENNQSKKIDDIL